ncbi:MAG: diguanylate cyclase, partial [Syntrophomonas sp.]
MQGRSIFSFIIVTVVGGLLFSLYSFSETAVVNTQLHHFLVTAFFGAMSGSIIYYIILKNQRAEFREFKILEHQMKEKVIALEQSNQELQTLILDDELTGLRNRRGFFALAEQQLTIANQENKDIIIIFADIDRMKWINDNYGHREGDQALKAAAWLLGDTFKEPDVVARIGGDEFAVISLQSSANKMDILIERLDRKINEFNLNNGKGYKLSMSVGIAVYRDNCSSIE